MLCLKPEKNNKSTDKEHQYCSKWITVILFWYWWQYIMFSIATLLSLDTHCVLKKWYNTRVIILCTYFMRFRLDLHQHYFVIAGEALYPWQLLLYTWPHKPQMIRKHKKVIHVCNGWHLTSTSTSIWLLSVVENKRYKKSKEGVAHLRVQFWLMIGQCKVQTQPKAPAVS